MTMLEAAALGSLAWAIVGHAAAVAAAWRRGTSRVAGASVGRAWPGVVYAFGPGMSPRAKESASKHPQIYAAGVLYHAGIAAAASTLVITLAGIRVPPLVARALAMLLLAAVAAGVGLLARRASSELLRAISAPDDYASNLLVDGWLATAALALILPEATRAFLVATILLGFYAPLGKIRHCVFFLLARGQFGAQLGRRGIVGTPRHGVQP
jgi:hypothetical protein